MSTLDENIPSQWISRSLGSIGDFFGGVTSITKEDYGHGTPFLPFKNVFNNSKVDINALELMNIKEKDLIKRNCIYGDIFFTASSETDDEVAMSSVLLDNVKDLTYNGFCKRYRLHSFNELNPNFARYFFRSKAFRGLIKQVVTGDVRFNISQETLSNIKILIPENINEQKAIAKVLTAFDDKIELLQKQNKTLESMAQTIFKEWFGKYQIGDELPEGWRVEVLGDVLETYLGGTPSKSKNEYWDNGSIPWINSGEVNNFRITAGTSLITRIGLEKSATKLLPKGTVVIAITGATLGQYSILEIDSCFNQSVIGIVGNSKIKSSFIYFWIANNIHAIIRNATGGAQQHINKEDVNSFEMIVPSDELLNRYQSTVEPMMDKITNNEFEIQSLKKTRDTLLPKLMSGQVRVNNIKQNADA